VRIVAATLVSIAVSGTSVALAQGQATPGERAATATQEAPDEVVVRGRRLSELRADIQIARERAYALFNELNSNDDFDVYCRKEGRSGTRSTETVCRAQFENRISSRAASEYLADLHWNCQPDAGGFLDTQACMFSGAGDGAKGHAQAVEGQLPGKREQMTEEIFRLARENDKFAQAILDWYEASQQLEAARKRRDD
jgi:hypothetical protein